MPPWWYNRIGPAHERVRFFFLLFFIFLPLFHAQQVTTLTFHSCTLKWSNMLRIYWRLSECDIVLLLLRCDYLRPWRVVIILPSVRDQQLVSCVTMSKRFLSPPPPPPPSVRSTARAIDHSPGSVMWKRQTDCSASRSTPEARLTLFVYMQLRSIGLSTEGDSKENLLLIYLPSRTLSCSVL